MDAKQRNRRAFRALALAIAVLAGLFYCGISSSSPREHVARDDYRLLEILFQSKLPEGLEITKARFHRGGMGSPDWAAYQVHLSAMEFAALLSSARKYTIESFNILTSTHTPIDSQVYAFLQCDVASMERRVLVETLIDPPATATAQPDIVKSHVYVDDSTSPRLTLYIWSSAAILEWGRAPE